MNQLLKRIAERSDHKQFKHATIVIKGGAVISFGANVGNRHSEVVALGKLWPSKRRGCSILNIRVRKDGSYGRSRPCELCLIYLKKNGVIRINYSSPGGFESERI